MNSNTQQPRKAFEVYIREKYYDVYDINGKEHEGLNDTPKTWWLYYADRLPEGLTPSPDSTEFLPWDTSIQRLVWDIRFKQNTYSKEKWGFTHFRRSTVCEIICNGKRVYAFSCSGGESGLSYAMAKCQYIQTSICEHPYNFLNPEEEKGRKIYWKGLPATVRPRTDGWEISIIPDYTAGLTREEWWKELVNREKKIPSYKGDDPSELQEDTEEEMRADSINWGDALSDKYIDWFRN